MTSFSQNSLTELLNCSQAPLLDGSHASLLDSSQTPLMHGTQAQRVQATPHASSLSSQTTLKATVLSATCSTCHKPFTLRHDGRLRVHGPYGAHCPGSGELPLAASSEQGCDPPPSDTIPLNFAPRRPHRSTLRRIPRGARQRAAAAFEDRVRGVTSQPNDIVN